LWGTSSDNYNWESVAIDRVIGLCRNRRNQKINTKNPEFDPFENHLSFSKIVTFRLGRILGNTGEIIVAARTAPGLRYGQIGGNSIDEELRGTSVILNGSVVVSGAIVEQLSDGFGGGFDSFRLGAGDGTDGDEQGGLDGVSVTAEATDDLLKSCNAGLVERGNRHAEQ
jgi:hypothetical protein